MDPYLIYEEIIKSKKLNYPKYMKDDPLAIKLIE
jgi:hypothetical protein